MYLLIDNTHFRFEVKQRINRFYKDVYLFFFLPKVSSGSSINQILHVDSTLTVHFSLFSVNCPTVRKKCHKNCVKTVKFVIHKTYNIQNFTYTKQIVVIQS